MAPAEIPRPQSQRITLYEQRFGKFDSGKNAYWSLRKERPVTLAEGAAFDRAYKAGQLAPPAHIAIRTTLAPQQYARPVTRVDTVPVFGTAVRLGWWRNAVTGETRQGTQARPPSRMAGWQWSPTRPAAVAPQERYTTMPTEAVRVAMLPDAPPPGPAKPPAEPMFDAVMRMLREQRAGPATEAITTRPAFATPGRAFADAVPAAAAAAPGFDMKKLILPAVLIGGAFVVSKML